MEEINNYLIAVCSAAILCAILKQVAGKGKMSRGTICLLSGLFVAICIISPWKDFSVSDLNIYNPLETNQAQTYVENGWQMTQKNLNEIITENTEAYILEKANQLCAQVEVRVELTDDGIPVSSVIAGSLTHEQKEELSAFLQNEVGIKKEMQLWK